MELSLTCAQSSPIPAQESSALALLLERGMHYARQQRFTEAMTAFAQASQHLSPLQTDLESALDAVTQSHSRFSKAHKKLLESSKCFSEAMVELEGLLANLEQLLPSLLHPLDEALPSPTPDRMQRQQETVQTVGTALQLPSLECICFGTFQVKRLGQGIELCQNRKGQAIMRYLVAKPGHRESSDRLMEVLFGEDEPDVARHKLEVALSALRCSLNRRYSSEPGAGYILFRNGAYQINTAVGVYSDAEEFLQLYEAGSRAGDDGLAHYERACRLYAGPFLPEDLYADWSFIQREHLSQLYLKMCSALAEGALSKGHFEAAVQWSTASLGENRCDERAHQQLIRAYLAQGRRSEAMRQYQRCRQILEEELAVPPLPETANLVRGVLPTNQSAIAKRAAEPK